MALLGNTNEAAALGMLAVELSGGAAECLAYTCLFFFFFVEGVGVGETAF